MVKDKKIWRVKKIGEDEYELFIYNRFIIECVSEEHANVVGERIQKIINSRMKYAYNRARRDLLSRLKNSL